VISIGKLTNAEAAVRYLQHAVADSAVDYYSGKGEAPGQWYGRGADCLALTGEVTTEQLTNLLSGSHPLTGQDLGRRWWSQKVVAFDVTFSAPKSVSILYALGGDEVRREVIAAHEAGVDAALEYLQKHAGWARKFNEVTGKVEVVPAQLVMPRFRHRTARPVTTIVKNPQPSTAIFPDIGGVGQTAEMNPAGPTNPNVAGGGGGFIPTSAHSDPSTSISRRQGAEIEVTTVDPQLHTHVPVPTWVCRPDGSWSALMSEPLYMHAAAAGAAGQAAMRKVLVDRLGVEVEVLPNGTFEIVGISEAQRREFSKRRQQIEAAEAVFGVETIHGREVANLATRERKGEHGAGPEVFTQWSERALKVGLDRQTITALLHRRRPAREFQLHQALVAEMVGERGLTAEAATFSRRDVTRKLASLATDGLALPQIETLADRILADSRHIVPLGPQETRVTEDVDFGEMNSPASTNTDLNVELRGAPTHSTPGPNPNTRASTDVYDRDESQRVPFTEMRYSTPEMVALERRMLEIAAARRGTGVAVVDDTLLAGVLADRPTLTGEQRAMVETVCRAGDGVVVVEGVAGAGKTFALDACREAFEASGHTVVGYALAGRAAQTLQEEASIPSHTIARAIPHLLEERLAPGSVVIVDEAGMVGDRQMAQLVELTARDGAKLVSCGDSRQLQPLDAGSPFRVLGDHLGRIELKQSLRHSQMWERVALGLIREGEVGLAVEMYRHQDRIEVSKTAAERRRRIVAEALQSRAGGHDTVVVAKTRDEAAAVNELTRAVLHAKGELAGEAVRIGGREFQLGDQVICTRPGSRLGIVNGLRGEVVVLDASAGKLTLRTQSGDVTVDGRLYDHLDYGYALTAHKAQGMTTDVALVAGSEAASREWAYSVMSRARVATRYFTVEAPVTRDLEGIRHGREVERDLQGRLIQSWSHSEAKDSTLDYEVPLLNRRDVSPIAEQ
jgi:AAA domain/TrwC relaxase